MDETAVQDVTVAVPSLTEVDVGYPHFLSSALYTFNCQLALTSSAQAQFNCDPPPEDDTYTQRLYSSIFVSIAVAVIFVGLVACVIAVWWFLAKHDNWDVYTGVDGITVPGNSNEDEEDDDEDDDVDYENGGLVKGDGSGEGSVDYDGGGVSEAESANSKNSGSAESLITPIFGDGQNSQEAHSTIAIEDLFRPHLRDMGGEGGRGVKLAAGVGTQVLRWRWWVCHPGPRGQK